MTTKKSIINILVTIPIEQTLTDEIKNLAENIHITSHAVQNNEDIAADVWAQTEVLLTDQVLPEPDQVPNLRWIQFNSPEIGFIKESLLVNNQDVLFTTSSGAGVSTVAEYVVMMMLASGHRLSAMISNQANAKWPEKSEDKIIPRKELSQSTVGIVGYGSVGREIARQLQSFGVKILAIKRDVMNPQDEGYCEPGLGDPGGDLFHRLYPVQALFSMVNECDFVICCLPDTWETQNIFDEEAFQSIKQGAYFIQIGGKRTVNEGALFNAAKHRLGGAVMDTFSIEPLSQHSPLWHLPNVIITPHLAGLSAFYNQRVVRLLTENLKNYISGTPLLNLYDRQLGY